jgi:hypothetical protein
MRDYDGNEYVCGTCGEEEAFTVQGSRYAYYREWGEWSLVECDTEGNAYDVEGFEDCDSDLDDVQDESYDEVRCCTCGENDSLVLRDDLDDDDWNRIENWTSGRPSPSVSSAKSVVRSATLIGSSEERLIEVQKALAAKIKTAADMDTAFNLFKEAGYVAYRHGPEFDPRPPWTDARRRVFELGRTLVSHGFESVNYIDPNFRGKIEDGDLFFRRYDVYATPTDNLMALDMDDPPEASGRNLIMLQVLKDIPFVGVRPVKHLAIMCPSLDLEEEKDNEWDDLVFILDITDPEQETSQIFENPTHWDPETFDELTLYTCKLDQLRQTLEVVFDITPGGFIPLKSEAREEAVTSVSVAI